jgi:type VI secretion system protein ImpA
MTVDLAALLQPLQPDAPCGEDLAFSGSFDAIARAREQDDPALAQGAWVAPLKVADWPAVARTAEELLLTRSKDLRLAAWWAEAQASTRGWRGLADGLQLVEGLLQVHWEGVHPLPEGRDFEQRTGAISWLLNRVAALATVIVLPLGRNPDGRGDLRASLADVHRLRMAAPAGEAERPGPERLARALRDTPAATWREQLADHEAARRALAALEQAVDARLGQGGPGFRPAREALDQAGHELLRLAREAGWRGGAAATQAPQAAVAAEPATQALLQAAGSIRSREEAIQRLLEVAEWFRRAEPHSPAGYLAGKAAHWAGMPLHEWLRAVLKDGGSLSHVQELLGVPAAPPAE